MDLDLREAVEKLAGEPLALSGTAENRIRRDLSIRIGEIGQKDNGTIAAQRVAHDLSKSAIRKKNGRSKISDRDCLNSNRWKFFAISGAARNETQCATLFVISNKARNLDAPHAEISRRRLRSSK